MNSPARLARRPFVLALALALCPLRAGASTDGPTAPAGDSGTPSASGDANAKDAPPRQGNHADDKSTTQLTDVVVTAVPLGRSADQLVTPVSVLSGSKLDDARGGTIGQTVAGVPGVQMAAFGNGVGRPVIRGLDGSRVAVLSDGLGSADVSNVSQDHAVAVEPFLADQVEILKGPSTLLYGSGAIGGVVNLVDGRIPQAAPANGLTGRAQINYDSVSSGRTGMFRVDTGNGSFALHADGLYRRDDDYDIPGRTLANSFVHGKSGAAGASWLGDFGYLGFSVSRYLDNYGNPAEPGDPTLGTPAVRVSMGQTRYDVKGAFKAPLAGIDKAEFSFGHTDYQHVEYEGDRAGTRFTNQSDEGRLQFTHATFAGWTGAFGLQAVHRDFAAVGEESFVPPSSTRGIGLFVTEQREFGPLNLELGARGDSQSSTPQNGTRRQFHPLSLSGGFAWHFDERWHLSFNLDRAQRAPAEEELFSHGPHAASATFEIGDANLNKETANQAELGLHYHSDFVEAKVSVYANHYADFIYLADTGEVRDDFPVRVWSQHDARFRGGEAEAKFHLARNDSGHYDLRVWGDSVRANLAGGGNLPRIPAGRLGGEFSWHSDDWRASLGATHYFRQDRITAFETETAAFTLVDARLAWDFYNSDRASWEAFINADNLTNQTARLSTSLIKDQAPLAGRSFSLGLRALF